MTAIHATNEEQPVFHLIQLFDLEGLNPAEIDAIEIYPCVSEYQNGKILYTEQCHPDVAQFYSVFFRFKTGVPQRIADCADSKTASHLAKCLARILNIDF